MTKELLKALEDSDVVGASRYLNENLTESNRAWEIHLSLFPLVQRVLNPPFINPHLPKMYRICREFIPYLETNEIEGLVRLEVNEYARRPKLEKLPKKDPLPSPVSFKEVESAIGEQDREKTAVLMRTFLEQKGIEEAARRLLLLGSGYLSQSLGHSVSCTAFILLEMMEQKDRDPWPALLTLADYFCKGRFKETPPVQNRVASPLEEGLQHHVERAVSGEGIVNLHHTITLYATERVAHLFRREEHDHMISRWISFMEGKKAELMTMDDQETETPVDYNQFYNSFSRLETKPVIASLRGMLGSHQERKRLGRYLIRGLCDLYQGNYNPHYVTGLGSALWVVDRFWKRPPIALNAVFQYLSFFFGDLNSDN